MKHSKKTGFFLGLIGLIGLSGMTGCARYRAKPLHRLESGIFHNDKKSFIALSHRAFDAYDCKTYLDRDVISAGYQPIQICLINNSQRRFRISKDSFSFPCVHHEIVAQAVHTSTASRATGYGIAALFIWPFLIPAIIDGIGSSEANTALDADFEQKALHNQIVGPFSAVNGLVFASMRGISEDFSLTVIDPENNEHFVLSPIRSKINV